MALPNATWSGYQIVTAVSRLTGCAGDSQSRAAILDYINLALWEISLESHWDWNALTAADITVATGTSEYNMPTAAGSAMDSVYDVRLVGSAERTLYPTDLREWDRLHQGEQDAVATPTHYTVFGGQQGGKIRLLPTPGAGDLLRIRYFCSQAAISDATASSLAMADKYVPLVVFKSAANVAGWKTPDRVAYWEAKYAKALARAQDVDRVGPDDTPTLIPQVQHSAGQLDMTNLTDLDIYPRG